MRIRALIIDDEPPARRVLEKFVASVPEIELVASCASAGEARAMLLREPVDLMFLDIRMPGESGLEFVRTLQSPPFIVFVTAFAEHAVEGFELEAVDYLVKPFSETRFRKAMARVLYLANVEEEARAGASDKVIMIKSDKKLYRMPCNAILYLESVGDYVRLFTTRTKPLLPKTTLKGMLEQLPAQNFIQIHRSYAVAVDAIQFIEGNQVSVNGTLLPVSDSFRPGLMERMAQERE